MRSRSLVVLPIVVVFAWAVLRSAWVMDDAYISFRTVDNVIHGYGLRWNSFERVDAFTNPLWTLVLSTFALVTRDVFWTSHFLQIAVSVAVVWLVTRFATTTAVAVGSVVALSLSKAFVDYSTSGLENPITHLVLVAFAFSYLSPHHRGQRALARTTLWASLALVSRLDMAWILAPCMFEAAWRAHETGTVPPRAMARALLAGASPFLAWEAFSFFYYGALIPNSALAKLTSGAPRLRLIAHGLSYFRDSIQLDPVTLLLIALGVAFGIARGTRRERAIVLGILATLFYVAWVGGDHMSGRFFSVPVLLAVIVIARVEASLPRRALFATAGAVAFAAWTVDLPTFSDRYFSLRGAEDYDIDDYRRMWFPHTGLLSRHVGQSGPAHEWVTLGVRASEHPDEVQPWGGIGLAGYYGGPHVRVLDAQALADPLLARLPIPDATHEDYYKMGHFIRAVPDGYVETLRTGRNAIRHPSLHAYYDRLAYVTRGPLWSANRLLVALKLNAGGYDSLLKDYVAFQDQKPVAASALAKGEAVPKTDSMHGCPTHWNPCAAAGVAFFAAGARVTLAEPSHASRVVVRLTPGTYTLVFRREYREVASVVARSAGAEPLSVEPPAPAREQGFDAVSFLPDDRSGGEHTLVSFVAEPPG
jgi:arabinofuranosyltransferase